MDKPSLSDLYPVAVLLQIISGRDADSCSGAEYFGEIDHGHPASQREDSRYRGRSPQFLCAGSIPLHQDSPFCEMVQAHDWIVPAGDARAHYMFLLGGEESVLRWSVHQATPREVTSTCRAVRADTPS
jgi:hypothetical protein